MIYLAELVDLVQLRADIANGYITERYHPTEPLAILNYTAKAQFENYWTNETKICRGLIYDTHTGLILARPFAKFFNYGQPYAAQIGLDEQVVVTDKADGSLGIVYPLLDGTYAVATRGSFTSDQAIKATEMLRKIDFRPNVLVTPLVEIIYPDNRIVLDYGQEEKLVLLGSIYLSTGDICSASVSAIFLEWGGEVVQQFDYETFADALAAKPRKNAEGLVVRALDDDRLIKIKQEDYVQLHRLVFGLNERTVWEHLCEYGNIDKLIEDLPDEFHGWVKEKADKLCKEQWRIYAGSRFRFEVILSELNDGFNPLVIEDVNRKEFAERAKEFPFYTSYLFMLLDGKDINKAIWKSLKPKGNTVIKTQSEDVA